MRETGATQWQLLDAVASLNVKNHSNVFAYLLMDRNGAADLIGKDRRPSQDSYLVFELVFPSEN